MFRLTTKIFFVLATFQWAIISYLIVHRHHKEDHLNTAHLVPFMSSSIDQRQFLASINDPFNSQLSQLKHPITTGSQSSAYEGVAVTLMVNAPKWFQRRYTTMIQNILDNTPPSWAVQIFYTPTGQSQFGLDINPGILRMNSTHERIIMTQLPNDMVKKIGMKRKKLYWTNEWIWNSMVADSVFVFSGNGALCSNSKLSLLDGSAMELFERFDYIGTPWWNHGGGGGSGSISYRNRTAMLNALRDQPYDGNDAEDYYFIKALKTMNKNGSDRHDKGQETWKYRVATKADTQLLGGINVTDFLEENGPPMVISGTLSNIDHDVRGVLLEMCPEVKRIFPSLHNPACFGAHPDSEACAKSICALKEGHHSC